MISAGNTTPKAQGIRTIDTLPKPIHEDQQKFAQFICGGGWIPDTNKAQMGKFLREGCVNDIYGLYKDYLKGVKGEQPGRELKDSQFAVYNNVLARPQQGAYFRAIIALEQRAAQLSRGNRIYPAQVRNNADANFANGVMYEYFTGRRKFIVLDLDAKKTLQLTLEDVFKKARELALKGVSADKIIPLPPSVSSEIDRITKILPPGWKRDRVIYHLGRLYAEGQNELKISRSTMDAEALDTLGKRVVAEFRNLGGIPKTNKNPTDEVLKAAYGNDRFLSKVTVTHVNDAKAVEKTEQPKPFESKVTATDYDGGARSPAYTRDQQQYRADNAAWQRLPQAQRRQTPRPTAPNARHYNGGINSPAYQQAVAREKAAFDMLKQEPKKVRDVEMRVRVNNEINVAIGSGRGAAKAETFKEQVYQADAVRDQMVKALKRFYPNEAGVTRASRDYRANRNELMRRAGQMVAATFKGMKMALAESTRQAHELEALGVVLVGGSKNPDYVRFRIGAVESTGEVPRSVLDGIGKGDALRSAVAMRRYQQAKAKMGDAAKDPAKLRAMGESLTTKLKDEPTDRLLRSQVAEVKPDGTVIITFAPGTVMRHVRAHMPKIKEVGAIANPKHPDLGVVDIVDRIKELYDQIIKANASKLAGADGDAKKAGILDALVDKLLDLVKRGNTGFLWKKNAILKKISEKPSSIVKRDAEGNPAMDDDGNVIYVRGYDVELEFVDACGGGGGQRWDFGSNTIKMSGAGRGGLTIPGKEGVGFGYVEVTYARGFGEKTSPGKQGAETHKYQIGGVAALLGYGSRDIENKRILMPHIRRDEKGNTFRVNTLALLAAIQANPNIMLTIRAGLISARGDSAGGALVSPDNSVHGLAPTTGASSMAGADIAAEFTIGKGVKVSIIAKGGTNFSLKIMGEELKMPTTHRFVAGGKIEYSFGKDSKITAVAAYDNSGAQPRLIPNPDGGSTPIDDGGSQAIRGEVGFTIGLGAGFSLLGGARVFSHTFKDQQPANRMSYVGSGGVQFKHSWWFKGTALASYAYNVDKVDLSAISGNVGPTDSKPRSRVFSADLSLLFRPTKKSSFAVGVYAGCAMLFGENSRLCSGGAQATFDF